MPPAAIQRDHQLPVPAFARRDHLHECLELADQLARLPDRELRLDPLLLRFLTELLEPCDLRLGERLEREVGQRVAAPQGERIGRASCRPHRLADARLREQLLEANRVQRLRVDVEHISGRSREQRQVVAEQASQARDVRLDRVLRTPRRLLRPEVLHETILRDDAAVVHEQDP